MTAFFSIGVTTYKRRELLLEALASILEQTFHDYEVIVGNDCTEESLSGDLLGLTDERIRFVNHSRNLGEMSNMNLLLAESSGRYFTWLADDDMYAPTFLEAVHVTLVKFAYPPCVFTSYMAATNFPEGLKVPVQEGECFKGRQFLQLYLSRTLKTQGCYGVFDAQYLRTMGGMEQLGHGFSPYADNLLVIKAAQLPAIAFIGSPLIFYRLHEQSISLTSTDVDAYTSAQEGLCSKSISIFASEGLKEDFQLNVFLLLRWCVGDFATVLHRSGRMDRSRIIAYLLFIRRHVRLLRGSFLYWRVFGLVAKLGCRLVCDIGRKKFADQLRL